MTLTVGGFGGSSGGFRFCPFFGLGFEDIRGVRALAAADGVPTPSSVELDADCSSLALLCGC
jgi:hypothetical protein